MFFNPINYKVAKNKEARIIIIIILSIIITKILS